MGSGSLRHLHQGHVCRNIVGMADEGTVDTFEHTIGGRSMRFRHLKRSQLMMMQRLHQVGMDRLANLPPDVDRATIDGYIRDLSDATWTTIESLFTSPDDLHWVQMAILRGDVEEKDLTSILFGGEEHIEPAPDDADPAPKKPRKAAAKKAAPKKAAPRRAAR